MTQDPNNPPNKKMEILYHFFDRNKTIFTMIAIFGALAGFLYSFNKTTVDENLVFGILFLVILMGLLMFLILYDVAVTLLELMNRKDDNFFMTFQIFFLIAFTILFLMFYESLIEYLYTKYPDWLVWLGIVLFLFFMMRMATWSNAFVLKKIGNSIRTLIFTIVCYSIIFVIILYQMFSLFIGLIPNSSSSIEIHTAQMFFLIGILLLFFINSILYFTGILIKQVLTSDKTA
jgi:hypothetical protein